jgi:hypothetical protein
LNSLWFFSAAAGKEARQIKLTLSIIQMKQASSSARRSLTPAAEFQASGIIFSGSVQTTKPGKKEPPNCAAFFMWG